MAGGHLQDFGAHALRGEAFQIRMDGTILAGHDGPTRLCPPCNAIQLLLCEQVLGWRKMSGPDDPLLLGGQISGEVGDAVRLHPNAAIRNFDMPEDICLRKFVLLSLRCLTFIRPERRDIDQGRYAVIHAGVRYDGAPVRVTDKDNRAADSPE